MTEAKAGGAASVRASVSKVHAERDIARIEQLVAQATHVYTDYDRDAGWPPRLKNRREVRPLEAVRWRLPLPVKRQLDFVELARSNAQVQDELVGRVQLLGCHALDHKLSIAATQRVRVCFANYSRNCLIDVLIADGRVERVVRRPSQCHPEAPAEMALAIELASSHPALKDQVEGLEARAILQMPHPRSPYREHRCLLVVFTEQPDPHVERRALYSAIVDLHLQQVIHAGDAPCGTGA
jgi:hypothetical protein